MPDGQDSLVALGVVAKPHGVRGELRLHRYNPDSSVLDSLERATLRKGSESQPVRILSSRPHGQVLLLTLRGVDDRDGADALRGWEVCVRRDELPAPDESEYYLADLVGLDAYDRAGARVGAVSDVIQYPTADCLEIRSEGGRREVPMLEPYLVEIDFDSDRLVVDHLDDLDFQADK